MSRVLPPDLPPTVAYEMYPGTYVSPFHYPHPVPVNKKGEVRE